MFATIIVPASTDFYTIDVDGTVLWNEDLTDEQIESFEDLLAVTGDFMDDGFGFFVHKPTYEAHKAELAEEEAEFLAYLRDIDAAWQARN